MFCSIRCSFRLYFKRFKFCSPNVLPPYISGRAVDLNLLLYGFGVAMGLRRDVTLISLLVQPHQALHLADTHRRVYVVVQTHLQRGKFLWTSEKAGVAAAPTWDRNQRVCEFEVEALEASGTLRWAVRSHCYDCSAK